MIQQNAPYGVAANHGTGVVCDNHTEIFFVLIYIPTNVLASVLVDRIRAHKHSWYSTRKPVQKQPRKYQPTKSIMDIENVPELLNGSCTDLAGIDAPDVDTILMKKPAVTGDTTERIKRRVRRQSSREGITPNGGGCTPTTMLGIHHNHKSHHHHHHSGGGGAGGSAGGGGVNVGHYFAPTRRWKNSRRSRNNGGGHSGHTSSHTDFRGLPKKGGAGGKGCWGSLGSELLVEEDVCDAKDPNYDSEANDAANTELLEVRAVPTAEEFCKLMEPVLLEYFANGDTAEAVLSLVELVRKERAMTLVPHIVSGAVELSLNHKDSHREMTSLLISDLYGRLLRTADIERGFTALLANLADLVLDTPEAPTWLGNFIARAVADDCIPPRFVFAAQEEQEEAERSECVLRWERHIFFVGVFLKHVGISNPSAVHSLEAKSSPRTNGDGGTPNGADLHQNGDELDADAAAADDADAAAIVAAAHLQRIALKRADSLLSLKTTMVHLDNIWGAAGPLRPVKNITKRMTLLLREFIDSRDVAEAQRCVRALEVPHYHHELVYEAIVMALESVAGGSQQQDAEAMCELLAAMDEACLVSPAMMEQVSGRRVVMMRVFMSTAFDGRICACILQGFQRVFDDIDDIKLDVPLAPILLDRFVERCQAAGFLSESIVAKMPNR